MKAVVCHDAQLELADVSSAPPGLGQVLVQVLRCGICGSDLHARHHSDELGEAVRGVGYQGIMRSEERIVFGHEFCGEVAEYGPGCRKRIPTGSHVVALPVVRHNGNPHATGFSTAAPGAYAEQVVVQESLMLPVPNGLSVDLSTLTEPMAVAWHAVRRSEVGKRDVAIVIGCGPIGLAVICLLKARGVRTVVASDLSPARRALAARCGADVIVDPGEQSPYRAADRGHLHTLPEVFELAMSTTEKLQRLPVSWHHVWRVIERLGLEPKGPVIFECVGVPGMLDAVITSAPFFSRVIGVGVCMGADRIRPAIASQREIDLRFVFGYTPLEFRDTLHMLAEGKINVTPLLTGIVGLPGVEAAFDALSTPNEHAKILIDPRSDAAEPVPLASV